MTSLPLQSHQRAKLDESDDTSFYAYPRFVTHVDEFFLQKLTDVYRQYLQPNSRVLDLMSSWVSHLPDEMTFAWVEGHGMNSEELARNPRLDHYLTQNLNENPRLPFDNEAFDVILIAVSVQYLQYPEAVFAELYRLLQPGGLVIVSFSNRMFYQKAISAWRDAPESRRVELVKSYFRAVPGFNLVETIAQPSSTPPILQMLGISGADPFYAVIGQRGE